jgi:hypothetical protein
LGPLGCPGSRPPDAVRVTPTGAGLALPPLVGAGCIPKDFVQGAPPQARGSAYDGPRVLGLTETLAASASLSPAARPDRVARLNGKKNTGVQK